MVPVLLYGCEKWKMNKADNKLVDIFHSRYPQRTLRIHWEDHVSTEELPERARIKPLSEKVKLRRWKMIGHIRQDQSNDCDIGMT